MRQIIVENIQSQIKITNVFLKIFQNLSRLFERALKFNWVVHLFIGEHREFWSSGELEILF